MIDLVAGVLAAAGITGPPVRLPYVTKSLGIVVEAYFDAPREYDASLVRHGKRTLCWYNPRKIDTRIRFSIAHEIGHLFLHECQWNGELPAYDSAMEREADAFAAELLMPTEWMLEICLERPSFDELRKIFWVSKQAMRRRLHDLGLYVPITKYDVPSFNEWAVLDRDIALHLYSRWNQFHPAMQHHSITDDPYEDYLIMRGVARSRSEAAWTVSDLESFPLDNSTDPSPVAVLSSL